MDELQRRHIHIMESIFQRHAFRIATVQPLENRFANPFDTQALRYRIVEERPPIVLNIEILSGLIPSWTEMLLHMIQESQRADFIPAVALLTSIYKEVVEHQGSSVRIRQP